jgi:hypothetical protein
MVEQTIVFADTALTQWITTASGILLLLVLTFIGPKVELPEADWRKVVIFFVRRLMIRLVICFVIAAPIYGLWPKYFCRLQISDQGILLDYTWPKADVLVSYNQVQSIIVDRGSKRIGGSGRRHRSSGVSIPVYSVDIKTARGIFSSRWVEQLTKQQKQAIDDLRLLIQEKRRQ